MSATKAFLILFFILVNCNFSSAMVFPNCNSVELIYTTETLAQKIEASGFLRSNDPEVLKEVLRALRTESLTFKSEKNEFRVNVVTPHPNLKNFYLPYSQEILRIRQAMETLKVPLTLKQRILERVHKALRKGPELLPSTELLAIVSVGLIGSAIGVGVGMAVETLLSHTRPSYFVRSLFGVVGVLSSAHLAMDWLEDSPKHRSLSFSSLIEALKLPVRISLQSVNEISSKNMGGELYIILQDPKEIEVFRDKILEALKIATPNGYTVVQKEVPNE